MIADGCELTHAGAQIRKQIIAPTDRRRILASVCFDDIGFPLMDIRQFVLGGKSNVNPSFGILVAPCIRGGAVARDLERHAH